MYIASDTFSPDLEKVLIATSAKIPAAIPEAIPPVKIVKTIMINGPNAFSKSVKSIVPIVEIMLYPTKINAGPVAAFGIIKNNGANKIATRNSTAVVMAVRPVFPPTSTPAEDSTNVVTVVHPAADPSNVPTASTINGRWISG